MQRFKTNTGLTLIETLVVLSIVVILISFSATIDLNSFKQDNLREEEKKIVAVLERARSRAMANFKDDSHGVCKINDDYVLFKGNVCTATDSDIIPAATSLAITFPTKIVFERLSGNLISAAPLEEVIITSDLKTERVEINEEGRINW